MTQNPLVSVVIPCYNHGQYLQRAINSVLQQSYSNIEVIVVDDGSIDNSQEVACQNPRVNYFFQNNQGLSAARNTGIHKSEGELLVFLDADDYLYEDAVAINLDYIRKDKLLAFVSGSHDKIYTDGRVQQVIKTVPYNHYIHLLKGNYIGMHATVMYRRWVFDDFIYDMSLKACEDYDLYLKIARKHPILHHANKIAAYCLHQANMSNNIPLMLTTALQVLKRQKNELLNSSEANAYAEGIKLWKAFYIQLLSAKLLSNETFTLSDYYTLLRYDSNLTFRKVYVSTITVAIYNIVKRTKSKSIKAKFMSYIPKNSESIPTEGRVNLGDFNRLSPFSNQRGYDRGGPIDKYYIENFLGNESLSIKGRTLEIGDNKYALYYGGDRVEESNVLQIDESNPDTPIFGDISNVADLASNSYDCIIIAQALHLVYNFKDILSTCYRILKPGGIILLTVPGITPLNFGEQRKTCYWAFTDKSVQRLIEETFQGGTAEVHAYGNIFTATAFMYGMGVSEIEYDKLAFSDPKYQVVITARATKALQY